MQIKINNIATFITSDENGDQVTRTASVLSMDRTTSDRKKILWAVGSAGTADNGIDRTLRIRVAGNQIIYGDQVMSVEVMLPGVPR